MTTTKTDLIPAIKASVAKSYDDQVANFKANPSAANWLLLQAAMLALQYVSRNHHHAAKIIEDNLAVPHQAWYLVIAKVAENADA